MLGHTSGTLAECMDDITTNKSYEDFEYLLERRHQTILGGRPEVRPGEFKEQTNRAGDTVFVQPDLVVGTLAKAHELALTLETAFQRAVFLMFAVAEVHPFADGNGRLARAMMNAELAAASEYRILVVSSYRQDYLGGLRRLSRQGDPRVLPKALDRAHEYSSRLDYDDLGKLIQALATTNAFDDSESRIMKLPPPRAR